MVQLFRLNLLQSFVQASFVCQILVVFVLAFPANATLAEQTFPYVAYVTKTDAYVRSGPGQRYYPTQQLQQGYAVKVYRHDGDRWCAIRPPEGSFSWVVAHQVNQLDQGVAEVSAEQTITRVGSLLSPDRSAVQVLLPRGERIKVLNPAATDDSRWLRVEAPAGEFRWIAADDLSPQPPVETTPLPQQAATWTQQSDGSQQAAAFAHLSKSPSLQQPNKISAIPSGIPTAADSNAMDVVAGSPAELQLAQFQSQNNGSLLPQQVEQPPTQNAQTASLAAPRIRFQGMTSPQTPMTPRVAEIELRLSEIVVRTPAEWHFEQLKTEANGLLGTTDSSDERIRLRDLLEKIARFEQIQQRYILTPVTTPQPKTLVTSLPSPPSAETPEHEFTGMTSNVRERIKQDFAGSVATTTKKTRTGEAPQYDAVGRLKPVVSKRKTAPRYALVDDKGDVLSFVTPTPDLNLQPYLGQQIGIHGTRNYVQEFRRNHVTASRVTPIRR